MIKYDRFVVAVVSAVAPDFFIAIFSRTEIHSSVRLLDSFMALATSSKPSYSSQKAPNLKTSMQIMQMTPIAARASPYSHGQLGHNPNGPGVSAIGFASSEPKSSSILFYVLIL